MTTERTETKVRATDVRRGDTTKVNAGHGWWPEVDVEKVTRDGDDVLIWWLKGVGARTFLVAHRRRAASMVTVRRATL